MIKNYLKIALRNLINQKLFSFINIIGLAIGIVCSILIGLFVNYELSYDTYHEKAERTYRLAVNALIGDTKIEQTFSSAITFNKLLEDFPEIETGTKFLKLGQVPVHLNNKIFYESKIFAVDSVFYDVFTVPLIHGNPKTVLKQPNNIVLSKSTALKYFNSTEVIGKILTIDVSSRRGKIDFRISGVSEDMPENSHFHYNMLVSLTTFPNLINRQGWTQNNFISYLVLKEGSSKSVFESKLKEFNRKYMGEGEFDFDAWVAKGNYWKYYLQPITNIHLDSNLRGEFEANGNKTYVYIFSVISIVILFIACINFMNLSTARVSLRTKEVGLRKVVGSTRKKLILQFLLESVCISYIALIIALIIVEIILPIYRDFVGREIVLDYFSNFYVIPILISLGLFVGIIAGSHPAFVLSSFQPITILKNEFVQKQKKINFRNVLVVFQFAISIFLIIGTIIIYQQLTYLQSKNLGFEKEQVLIINNPGTLDKNLIPFKQSLLEHSNILNVSGSNTIPGKSFSNVGFRAEGSDDGFTLNLCICDDEYLETLRLKMSQGRFFSKEYPSDSSAAILNQKAAELLGWQESIGKKIKNGPDKRNEFNIIGVIEDYHYESLHQEIRPMALFLNGGNYRRTESYINIRLKTGNISETISFVKKYWNAFAPGAPFQFSFLDEEYNGLYINEKQTRKLFTIFSLLAIFIACLGLFGLTSFIADRKVKEIGIRKVLGASVKNIVALLNKNFINWILISNIIAWPIAWFVMNNWLQNFAYRIGVDWWVFVSAGIIALFIAFLTVSSQAIKTALTNPIESIRYE